MRTLIATVLLILVVQSSSAQAIWRNYWTTNQNPQITPSLLATNAAASNQVLTATSPGSAAWQTPSTSSGASSFRVFGTTAPNGIVWPISGNSFTLLTVQSTTQFPIGALLGVAGVITNFWIYMESVAIGAGTNITFYVGTNNSLTALPVPSHLKISFVGDGSTAYRIASNLTDSITITPQTKLCWWTTNNAASIGPTLKPFLSFDVVRQ